MHFKHTNLEINQKENIVNEKVNIVNETKLKKKNIHRNQYGEVLYEVIMNFLKLL